MGNVARVRSFILSKLSKPRIERAKNINFWFNFLSSGRESRALENRLSWSPASRGLFVRLPLMARRIISYLGGTFFFNALALIAAVTIRYMNSIDTIWSAKNGWEGKSTFAACWNERLLVSARELYEKADITVSLSKLLDKVLWNSIWRMIGIVKQLFKDYLKTV